MRGALAGVAGVLVLGVLGLQSVLPAGSSVAVGSEGDVASLILDHLSIRLLPLARADVERGLVDARILQILLLLADRHELTIGPFVTGHSYYVMGTSRPSNHAFGRAVDIPAVGGAAVSVHNPAALEAALVLGSLPHPLRPDELGAPWPLDFDGISSFTQGHADHLHVGLHT
ncbi:MAG: hypothetical protein ACRDJ4_01160 [Actinomycetota bacterium]